MSSVCRGLISVAGAAHVCGVISLILSDDDYAVKQAQLKSVLMARFSETAEIKTAGQVPIRVLKKFMQSVKKQSKSHLSSAYHVSTEAPDNTTLTIQRLVSTGIPSSPPQRSPNQSSQSLGKYQIKLCDADSVNPTMLNESQFAELMATLQAETPDFKTMATILRNGSFDGQGAVAKAVSQVRRVTVSWELSQGSRLQHVKQRNAAGGP
ncbi:hypothetical protein N7509_008125 [Penicillium cosmopolitanum]|uniref:Uncharacterized protein n=1 Tax=Penicillium cosmopolitanum TaxID=1131564 RepID=A0A9W9W0C4_9EURO|nr:uncharacterized protein N7509_008125 [Penicillium cosmopolitanum]KAJ5392635.1 hypothetical protein N7509_008125 [Penicillium cosmopolitanum]